MLSTMGAESAADSDLCVACSGLRGRILFGSSARSVPNRAARLRGFERYRAIPAETAAPGWAAVLADGFPLGFGKQSGGVVKNHYPKGLRNLK